MSRRSMILLALALPAFAAVEEGFTPLFDGQTLQGWLYVFKKETQCGYTVENGMIVSLPEGGGNLFTVKEYGNFILRFEFRMEPGANNGIGIRAPLTGDVAYTGMEIQILDHDHPKYQGWLQPWQRHGSIYGVVPARTGYLKPAGEWNEEEIVADGNHIIVRLNGQVIVDADLSQITDPEIVRKHPGLRRTRGHIGLLGHHSRVEFRNLRIKELP